MKPLTEREVLLAAVRQSRSELRNGILEARQAADIKSRARESVQRNLIWWIGGSILAGSCIASFTGNGNVEAGKGSGENRTNSSFKSLFTRVSRLARFVFTVSSPILKSFLTREVMSVISKVEWGGPSDN